MQNLYDLTRDQLTELINNHGYSSYHAEQLWQLLYQLDVSDVGQLDALRPELRSLLAAEWSIPPVAITRDIISSDGYTRKFLLEPTPTVAIETVIMQFQGRYTACVSTQAGCAMGCIFCATGQMGFQRHLSAGEIVAQVVHVRRELARQGQQLRNIVLMGMGEPLHNYDNTMRAIDIITDHKGLSIAARHITLSTVGLPHAIRRMADEGRQVRLAVSLHGATDAERQALVPIAKKWTLAQLIDACRYYIEQRGRKIFFEWTLIEGKNDSAEHAQRLGRLLQGIDATVNVIPLNPTDGYSGRPSNSDSVRRFTHTLRSEYGLRCTVRQRRGIDIAAGCGQLAIAGAKSA